jgi:hypothetical protein
MKIIVAFLLALLALTPGVSRAAWAVKPNIIFILADDLGHAA